MFVIPALNFKTGKVLQTTQCRLSYIQIRNYCDIVIKTKNYTCVIFLKSKPAGIKFTSSTWGYGVSNVRKTQCLTAFLVILGHGSSTMVNIGLELLQPQWKTNINTQM